MARLSLRRQQGRLVGLSERGARGCPPLQQGLAGLVRVLGDGVAVLEEDSHALDVPRGRGRNDAPGLAGAPARHLGEACRLVSGRLLLCRARLRRCLELDAVVLARLAILGSKLLGLLCQRRGRVPGLQRACERQPRLWPPRVHLAHERRLGTGEQQQGRHCQPQLQRRLDESRAVS